MLKMISLFIHILLRSSALVVARAEKNSLWYLYVPVLWTLNLSCMPLTVMLFMVADYTFKRHGEDFSSFTKEHYPNL